MCFLVIDVVFNYFSESYQNMNGVSQKSNSFVTHNNRIIFTFLFIKIFISTVLSKTKNNESLINSHLFCAFL